MTVTSVNTSTFISDTVIFTRDDLRTNITDPISNARPSGETFVLTAYPQREVTYPIITVKLTNIDTVKKLGLASEHLHVELPLEVRVWARNVKERDELTQKVINQLRDNQLGSGNTVAASLIDFRIDSAVDVDDPGEAGTKSKVITVSYGFILGP